LFRRIVRASRAVSRRNHTDLQPKSQTGARRWTQMAIEEIGARVTLSRSTFPPTEHRSETGLDSVLITGKCSSNESADTLQRDEIQVTEPSSGTPAFGNNQLEGSGLRERLAVTSVGLQHLTVMEAGRLKQYSWRGFDRRDAWVELKPPDRLRASRGRRSRGQRKRARPHLGVNGEVRSERVWQGQHC
jgi:hypothetical protein